MRDENRIDVVLAELGKYWHAHPDLRLGQIIWNMDIQFYTEDDEALKLIKNEENRYNGK